MPSSPFKYTHHYHSLFCVSSSSLQNAVKQYKLVWLLVLVYLLLSFLEVNLLLIALKTPPQSKDYPSSIK